MSQVNIGADTAWMSMSSPIALGASVAPGWYNSYRYAWSPAIYVDSPTKSAIHYNGVQDSMLYVTVTTPNGCAGSDSIYVVISNSSPMAIPNAFVPGSGPNGNFRVVKVEPGYAFRSMRIYDRWGRKMYETRDASEGWDGSVGGERAPMGVYVFVLEAENEHKQVIVQKGSFTLIR